jgi:hypothetical protein
MLKKQLLDRDAFSVGLCNRNFGCWRVLVMPEFRGLEAAIKGRKSRAFQDPQLNQLNINRGVVKLKNVVVENSHFKREL